ncbi:hypothetical protein [Leadbetterella byssophila]|uniref:hypothetical protein n=1 Tax=Leadbetterella byssophila TaxID=316068 RepID=UPI0039A076F4
MNKKQIKEELAKYKGQKVVALVVNVKEVTEDGIHILYRPGNKVETIVVKKQKVKNFESLKRASAEIQSLKGKDYTTQVVILEKSDDSEEQVPDVSQRPCPVTWIRFEQDGDDLDFDVI